MASPFKLPQQCPAVMNPSKGDHVDLTEDLWICRRVQTGVDIEFSQTGNKRSHLTL